MPAPYATQSPWLIPLPESPLPSATFPSHPHHGHAPLDSSALAAPSIKKEGEFIGGSSHTV